MAGPDSYILENPQIAFQRAYMFGQQIAAQQQAQREVQLKQQQALQAQQAMRMVYDNPTPENISRFYMAYPAYKEQFEAARKPLDEAAAADDLDFTARTLSLLANGKNDDAISLMDQRASSFGNTRGMEKQAEAARALVQTAKTDPKAARQLFALKLAAANPKLYETVFGKNAQTPDEKQYDAIVAKDGKAAADQWWDAKRVKEGLVTVPGIGVFKASDFGTTSPENLPRPQSQAERDALPAGSQYIAPNGQVMVKQASAAQGAPMDGNQPVITKAQYDAIAQAKGVRGALNWLQKNNVRVSN